MANLPRNSVLDDLSQAVTDAVLDARNGGFGGKDISRVRALQDHLNAGLCGLYLLDEKLRPNATLVSRPAQDFLKGYEAFRNRDPIFLHLLRRRRAMDGVSLLGFEAWVRHPLARYLRDWNFQHSLQGAISDGDRIIATINFARADKYGPFGTEEISELETLCELISTQLFLSRDSAAPRTVTRPPVRISETRKSSGVYRILTDGSGTVLNTDVVPATIHPCLTLNDLERGIAAAIDMLHVQNLNSVEREILENRTAIAKLCTFPIFDSSHFMTVITRSAPQTAFGDDPLADLGERTRQVLELLVRGYSNKLIAREMVISENTVKDHLRRLYSHFGVTSRTELTWILHGYV